MRTTPATAVAHLPPACESSLQSLSVPDVFSTLRTQPQGLSQAEAAARLHQYGRNVLTEARGKPLILKFALNFIHLMALLLWAGGVIAFIAQMPQLAVAIWSVNIINGLFSFWQEYKAERATEALRRLLPHEARVLRAGLEQRIPAEELVPGDVILLSEGDYISADGRLVQDAELRVDQSTLTGESYPVRKTSIPVEAAGGARAETPNLVFAGTSVAAGTGKAVVYATGMQSAFGTIARLTQSVGEEPSPLQQELGHVTRVISASAVGIGALFFVLAVLLAHVTLADSFIFAMGMIVAFVPEGLLPTVTLALAMGVQRMVKRHALVKRLSAVETLGCTSVICTDKTGTLTQNEMTVRALWVAGREIEVTGSGYAPDGALREAARPIQLPDADLHDVLVAAALCNDARLLPPNGQSVRWTVLGDPTEAALRVVAMKAGLDINAAEQQQPRVREVPFDSRRKRMSTIHQMAVGGAPPAGDGRRATDTWRSVAYVKGAPREVLALCTHIQQNGRAQPLTEAGRAEIMAANDSFARKGLRVLGVATRELPNALIHGDAADIERDLTFLGLIAMLDPPRPEIAEAVERCHHAGIRIVMITGDYGLTAESIARRIGIIAGAHPRIVAGADLDSMDDAALQAALRDEVIFARVAPEHKLRVVTALQQAGHIVAVTGDGVNDAPALKKADIGVAMGVVGTDVAKEAADMILTDDNFASIVGAVEEGRAVYANIRKFMVYVFNSNMAEAIPFILMLFSRGAIPLPLTVMQVLAIDLGTDMVPAIGLGSEAPESDTMDRPPRDRQAHVITAALLGRALLWYGLIESVASMAAYFFLNWRYGWRPGAPLAAEGTQIYRMATTMTFAGIVATQVGAVFGCRTNRESILRVGLFTNRLVLVGVAVELILLGLLVYAPFLHGIFNTAPLGPLEWAFVFAWTPLILLMDELRKALLRLKTT